jgi:hypothetical protein
MRRYDLKSQFFAHELQTFSTSFSSRRLGGSGMSVRLSDDQVLPIHAIRLIAQQDGMRARHDVDSDWETSRSRAAMLRRLFELATCWTTNIVATRLNLLAAARSAPAAFENLSCLSHFPLRGKCCA